MVHCLFLCCSSHTTHSTVPSRDGLETGIIIFAIAFTIFAVVGVAHFTYGAHFGLPSPTFRRKEANIIPSFKKGSINKSVNYRPVSLTSVICKVLETIIRDHMMDFLIKHKLINPSQHGFLKARSCLTNLLCFFEEITK